MALSWKRVHPRIEKLRAWIDDRFDNRVTVSGTLFSCVVVLVGAGAMLSANNLLFLIVAALLATLLISGFINRLTLNRLQMEFQLPEHLPARTATTAHVKVTNNKKLIPSFSVFLEPRGESGFTRPLYFPLLTGGESTVQGVEVRFARRGRYTENNFRFSTRFPFGFAERRRSVSLKGEVVIYPCLEAQAGFAELAAELTGEAATRERGRGQEFHSVRAYVMGESSRHLDWKATAHTGRLQVREFAREQRHLIELVLDTEAATVDAEWFEWAVECCAWLAVDLTKRDWPVRFRSSGADVRLPDAGSVYNVLKFLAEVQTHNCPLILPDESSSIPILFSARPHSFESSGWRNARLLGPAQWAGPTTRPKA